MPDDIQRLGTREVYTNPWIRLREDEVRFPDGSIGHYGVVDKRDFVLVLAHEEEGFWLVEQFRYPVGSREWEFPQGGWPPGGDGTQEELAAHELREEAGLRAGRFEHLGHLHSAYGFCSQGFDVFLATDLTPGPTDREATESDMVHTWRSAADVRAMMRAGTFKDAHSVAALALFDGRELR